MPGADPIWLGDGVGPKCDGSTSLILTWVRTKHRVITVIEVQRLVVLGSTALFTMVWQLCIYDDRYEGWENFLFVETE